jgi:hypothetical protein
LPYAYKLPSAPIPIEVPSRDRSLFGTQPSYPCPGKVHTKQNYLNGGLCFSLLVWMGCLVSLLGDGEKNFHTCARYRVFRSCGWYSGPSARYHSASHFSSLRVLKLRFSALAQKKLRTFLYHPRANGIYECLTCLGRESPAETSAN